MVQHWKDSSQGYLIGIEGIDGSGKTTLANKLFQYFIAKGIKVCLTKEPGDNPIGRVHRELSLIKNAYPYSTALISTADRYFKMPFISSKLSREFVVISDRYYMSGLAYHRVEGVSFHDYAFLNKKVIKPNAYLFLDIDLENALRRIKKAHDKWETMIGKVYFAYYEALQFLKKAEKACIIKISAGASQKDVFNQAIIALQQLLKEIISIEKES